VELVLALFYEGIHSVLGQQPHKLPFISIKTLKNRWKVANNIQASDVPYMA
jgi:hypothetical protein